MNTASAVLVSHAYPISLGLGAVEPLEPTIKMSLGTLAVLTLFEISGFFFSQSFDRRSSHIGFPGNHFLRRSVLASGRRSRA
jgi:peptidoglycan/LPS O-acetylase OafA/YrhL